MFQYSAISLKDLYEVMFEFDVSNSRKMRSDALIGSFKLDVGSVYDQPGASMNSFSLLNRMAFWASTCRCRKMISD